MKAILLSVRPEHALNILNGKKTLELRKTIPHDFVGWVYVYVTKAKPYLYHNLLVTNPKYEIVDKKLVLQELNGLVVAKCVVDGYTRLNHVQWVNQNTETYVAEGSFENEEILKSACLDITEVCAYGHGRPLYAWHIKRLEIFDKPMELKDFTTIHIPDDAIIEREENGEEYFYRKGMQLWHNYFSRLTRAPQSWQYVEVKGE